MTGIVNAQRVAPTMAETIAEASKKELDAKNRPKIL
jgi:hypothetical protein